MPSLPHEPVPDAAAGKKNVLQACCRSRSGASRPGERQNFVVPILADVLDFHARASYGAQRTRRSALGRDLHPALLQPTPGLSCPFFSASAAPFRDYDATRRLSHPSTSSWSCQQFKRPTYPATVAVTAQARATRCRTSPLTVQFLLAGG